MAQVRPYRGVDAADRLAERRRRLLDAGLDLLGAGEQDPAELTVRAICAQAGLGVRYFYESFSDKDDFVGAVFDSVVADLATTTQAAVASAPPEEQARAGMANIVRSIAADARVGRLLFGVTRSPDARLSGVLARNLAELANAVRLAADVQRSREHILRTREEERRRLRRDLHDGLGPTLASLAMTIDAARITLKTDPEAVDALLEELRTTMGSTIGDIRELVYGLRPPALDDLGLEGAIQALGGVVASDDGPKVDVQVEGDLNGLPAAAEVAAYRIVQEALTNVHRHAKAESAVVKLHLNGDLYVTVNDDGVGLPPQVRSGIGMSSMRERAAELGGSCTVGPGPKGGTLVRAKLPVNGIGH